MVSGSRVPHINYLRLKPFCWTTAFSSASIYMLYVPQIICTTDAPFYLVVASYNESRLFTLHSLLMSALKCPKTIRQRSCEFYLADYSGQQIIQVGRLYELPQLTRDKVSNYSNILDSSNILNRWELPIFDILAQFLIWLKL